MPKHHDSLLRLVKLLQLIPISPKSISTNQLLTSLEDQGFTITQRSLQRDLSLRLSEHFPLRADETQKPHRWYFDKQHPLVIPVKDANSALALVLAQEELQRLLPSSVMAHLLPYFAQARECLNAASSKWLDKVYNLPSGLQLSAGYVAPEVWDDVTQALLHERQLQIHYLSRKRQCSDDFIVHPLGLVHRTNISYLVARVEGFDNVRQFALPRIQRSQCLTLDATLLADFSLKDYAISGAFSYRQDEQQLQLVADVAPDIAWLLRESPLNDGQTLSVIPDSDWQRLEVQVYNDNQLLWWIMGLNNRIRLYQPQCWLEQLRANAAQQLQWYRVDNLAD